MPLTRSEKRKSAELDEMSEIVGVDYWNIDRVTGRRSRQMRLKQARDRIVRSCIISHYVIIDELLATLICEHFFGNKCPSEKLWQTKRYQQFNYYVIEELSLLKKVAMVKAFRELPNDMLDVFGRLNALRNAVAHSFYPENKRDYRRFKKLVYKGKDVFSLEGLRLLDGETSEKVATLYLMTRDARQYLRGKPLPDLD